MPRTQRVDLAAEMANAKLGDPRRSARLSRIVGAVTSAPGKSFPSLLDASELEGLYRFVGNENFDSAAVLEPHIAATVERCVKARSVVIVLGFEPMFRTARRKKLKSRSVEVRDPNNERLRWRRFRSDCLKAYARCT